MSLSLQFHESYPAKLAEVKKMNEAKIIVFDDFIGFKVLLFIFIFSVLISKSLAQQPISPIHDKSLKYFAQEKGSSVSF
jgi:hypothetical protein